MPVKNERCMMGLLEMMLCSMVWTLGLSAGWAAAFQSLCCPYFCCCLPPPLVYVDGLLFLPLCCPLAEGAEYAEVCGGGPYGYAGCAVGGVGGKVWVGLDALV